MPMNTNAVSEYFDASKLLNLDIEDLKEMTLKAVDSIFDDSLKEKIRALVSFK